MQFYFIVLAYTGVSEIIVIGGGLSNIKEIYIEGLNQVVSNLTGEDINIRIVESTLGDSSGALGAALIGI